MSGSPLGNGALLAIVPAYKPGPKLVEVVSRLKDKGLFSEIIAIDDGSGEAYAPVFAELERLGCTVLRHAVNLGKGMALKTGFNHACLNWPQACGVVTFDADGQHLPDDIAAVGQKLSASAPALVLGTRRFDTDVPLRSAIGNRLTRVVMALLAGIRVSDTQTGLRGIPLAFLQRLLRLKTTGYDFELDMLMAAGQEHRPFVEVPITTVYEENNKSSHFNPLLDSLKIYLVIIRFGFSSLLAAIVDYLVFSICILCGMKIFTSIVICRLISGSLNFVVNKKIVFKSQSKYIVSVILYVLLVCISGGISYFLIDALSVHYGWNVFLAKLLVESILYFFNFFVQREIVFGKVVD